MNDKMSNPKSQENLGMPPELRLLAENEAQDPLPSESKKYYEAAYEKFLEWKQTTRPSRWKIAFLFTLTEWLKNVNLDLVFFSFRGLHLPLSPSKHPTGAAPLESHL